MRVWAGPYRVSRGGLYQRGLEAPCWLRMALSTYSKLVDCQVLNSISANYQPISLWPVTLSWYIGMLFNAEVKLTIFSEWRSTIQWEWKALYHVYRTTVDPETVNPIGLIKARYKHDSIYLYHFCVQLRKHQDMNWFKSVLTATRQPITDESDRLCMYWEMPSLTDWLQETSTVLVQSTYTWIKSKLVTYTCIQLKFTFQIFHFIWILL